jgi:hypothetical protein
MMHLLKFITDANHRAMAGNASAGPQSAEFVGAGFLPPSGLILRQLENL